MFYVIKTKGTCFYYLHIYIKKYNYVAMDEKIILINVILIQLYCITKSSYSTINNNTLFALSLLKTFPFSKKNFIFCFH